MTTLTMSGNRPQQIADGEKRLTCRPVKPGDSFRKCGAPTHLPDAVMSAKRVIKWRVGGVYGIKPQRTAPVCLVDKYGEVVRNLLAEHQRVFRHREDLQDDFAGLRDALLWTNDGYSLLQVKVLEIKRVDVRDITHADALAEGFNRRSEFWQTWCELYDTGAVDIAAWLAGSDFVRIHLKTRPAELYDAWQLRFERVLP